MIIYLERTDAHARAVPALARWDRGRDNHFKIILLSAAQPLSHHSPRIRWAFGRGCAHQSCENSFVAMSPRGMPTKSLLQRCQREGSAQRPARSFLFSLLHKDNRSSRAQKKIVNGRSSLSGSIQRHPRRVFESTHQFDGRSQRSASPGTRACRPGRSRHRELDSVQESASARGERSAESAAMREGAETRW